ncbi:MAG: hypothetical protein KGI97_00815 [Alphaproteobacteria bacterium]|nr:hypothetical protein [Alphaproteobacteria bacterium]
MSLWPMAMPAFNFITNGGAMSPSVALRLLPDQPAAPVTAASANSNAQRKPRRRAARNPLPPVEAMNLAQKFQAADEFWHQLLSEVEKNDGKGSGAALAMFSCFVHSIIDDGELRKNLVLYFDQKLNDGFLSRKAMSS